MTDRIPDTDLAERILGLVGERGEAQVRISHVRAGLTRFANSFVHQHVGEDTRSVDLTVAVDGRVATTSTTRTDGDGLAGFVDRTVALAEVQPPDPHWPGVSGPAELHTEGHFDEETAAADPAARAELVRTFVDAAPDLRAAGFVDTDATEVTYANTAGVRRSGRSTRATIDGIHQTDRSAGSAHQTSARLRDLDAGSVGALAVERARRSAEFVDLEPGAYEVVLGPECLATMAVFLSVYGFNAKQHLEGQSFARPGEQQFDAAVTLTDDPTDPRAIGLPFDAEGTPKEPTPLITEGVTQGLVHDRRTAARMGARSTGNAVAGGETFGAYPEDMVVAGGTTPRDELVDGVERGLLITQFHYCRILDPKSQVVTGLTRNGTFLIEDGRLVGAVGNLRFTQSFLEALAPGAVRGVGDDARFADSEFGAGLVIAPSMRLASWNFTGGARG